MATHFFKCCTICRRTFTDAYLYREHVARLHPAKEDNHISLGEIGTLPGPDAEKRRKSAVIVANEETELASNEEAWRERTRRLREMKTKLINAGIECQTLNPEETYRLYSKALSEGKVK